MKLENMLKAVNAQQIIGDTNLEVNGIHMDSRMVKKRIHVCSRKRNAS